MYNPYYSFLLPKATPSFALNSAVRLSTIDVLPSSATNRSGGISPLLRVSKPSKCVLSSALNNPATLCVALPKAVLNSPIKMLSSQLIVLSTLFQCGISLPLI